MTLCRRSSRTWTSSSPTDCCSASTPASSRTASPTWVSTTPTGPVTPRSCCPTSSAAPPPRASTCRGQRSECSSSGSHPDADRPLVGMCDSARCPQATHHPVHRPVWAAHAGRTNTFIDQLGKTRTVERAVCAPTTTAPYASSPRPTPRPHPHPTRTHHENQRGSTSREPQPRPGSDGPCPARRDPAQRQQRHQDPGPRNRRRPHRLLRQPALRPPANRVREPPPAAASDRPDTKPAHRPDQPAQSRHRQAEGTPAKADQTIANLTDFRSQALARLAAQHDEIVRLPETADSTNRVTRLPTNRATLIGPC